MKNQFTDDGLCFSSLTIINAMKVEETTELGPITLEWVIFSILIAMVVFMSC